MISGFNTDIEHDGTVYHVQTEDKGLPARMIMSLVYDRGTILASKRVAYEELMNGSVSDSEVAEKVQRQHKLICAAVKAGRISELKGMSRKPADAKGDVSRSASASAAAPPERSSLVETQVPTEQLHTQIRSQPIPQNQSARPDVRSETPPAVKKPTLQFATAAPIAHAVRPVQVSTDPQPSVGRKITSHEDEPVFEAVEIVEEIVLPADAVVVVSELSGTERTAHEKLTVELLGETKFKSGDRRTLGVMICRGSQRKVVPGAQIMIKVLGSTFRPVIFHARSDANGLAKIHLQVPQFRAGRAALLVRVLAEGEEVEIRRAVTAF